MSVIVFKTKAMNMHGDPQLGFLFFKTESILKKMETVSNSKNMLILAFDLVLTLIYVI